MSSVFDVALKLVLEHEGGFVDDPDDPGGATKYGISNRAHGKDRDGDGDIDAEDAKLLGIGEASSIYKRDYWDRCKCDYLPPSVAVFLFDTAVNCGVAAACKMAQRAARVKDDGVIGPVSIQAISNRPALVLERLATERSLHYASLKTFKKYGAGWMRRVFQTYAAAIEFTS